MSGRVGTDMPYAPLPIDPEGWCSWEKDHRQHTTMCEEGVQYGHGRLCEAFDRWEQTHPRKPLSGYEQRQISHAEDVASGGADTVWIERYEAQARVRRAVGQP